MTTDRATRRATTMRDIARVIACALLLTVACRRSPRGQAAEVARSLPAAPDDLLALVVVPRPESTWQAVRTVTGDSGLTLAPAFKSFAGAWLKLPDAAVEQLETDEAILGATILANDAPQSLVAVHLKDAAQFVALATSPGSGFSKRQQAPDGMSELAADTPSPVQLAVADGYLVVATNLAAVRAAIPFVTRTLPGRPLPAADVVVTAPHSALAGAIRTALARWWSSWRHAREAQDLAMRKAHGGSAPDFGDPAQALADIDARAQRMGDILNDLREASVRVTLEGAEGDRPNLRCELMGEAATSNGPVAEEAAALSVGDGEQLLALPATMPAALLVYDSRATREEGASEKLESLGKVLGGRLEPSDHAKLEAALHGWARGRGDWLTVGMMSESGRRTGVWRGAVASRDDMQRAISSILQLIEVRAIAEPLSAWVGELTLSGFGDPAATSSQTVHIVRRPPKLRRRPSDAAASPSAFDAVWSVGAETATGAIGEDARAAHEALQRRSTKTLRDHPRLLQALARRGHGTSLVAFVDLARFGVRGADTTVVLSYGKASQDGSPQTSLTLDLPPRLLLGDASPVLMLLQP